MSAKTSSVNVGKILQSTQKALIWLVMLIPRVLGNTLSFMYRTSRNFLQSVKNNFVYRLFWGRGNLHRQILHATFILLTVLLIVTGISVEVGRQQRIQSFTAEDETVIGSIDLLQQGGSIQTVLASQTAASFRIFTHDVQEGDTIESLVTEYGINARTIKDSNRDNIDYWSEDITGGSILYIPEVPGVLYNTKQGDTIEWIMTQVENGDIFETLELNAFDPDEILTDNQRILIPNATLAEPPKPIPDPAVVIANAPSSNQSLVTNIDVSVLNGLSFVDPLSHPNCAGYGWSRGFFPGHPGVDLTRANGCPIRSIASGVVNYAGWGFGGQGHYVAIDHGNGILSQYFHGDGNIWVQTGQTVEAGQEIMNMGCTGWCTGTHVHLEVRVNGAAVDPAPYVPYARPY